MAMNARITPKTPLKAEELESEEATKLQFLNQIMMDQLKAALIIIVAMSGTVNVKQRDDYGEGSNGMTAKGSDSVECKDCEDSESVVRKCSDLYVAPSVEGATLLFSVLETNEQTEDMIGYSHFDPD